MILILSVAAAIPLLLWLYLLLARGGFWRIRDAGLPRPDSPPALRVAVIIPARDEAAVIGRAVASLIRQDYPGPFHVFLVDDHSSDGTAEAAREAVQADPRMTVIAAQALPPGWTGKLWALAQGIREAAAFRPDYFLLTDADIVHAPGDLSKLATHAQTGGFDLASYMVRLRCETLAEKAFIPAFVFFFLKLYPPAWIEDPRRSAAGAAGGCILLRAPALARAGGMEAIRGEIIDDCALAKAVKRSGGRLWLGLTSGTVSLREYPAFAGVGRMISRTAFTQLNHSSLLLLGTVLGMAVMYVLPPLLVFAGTPVAAALGACAWLLMAVCYVPALRFYRRSLLWAPCLPLIALFYTGATIHSAVRHWLGAGASWKGRSIR